MVRKAGALWVLVSQMEARQHECSFHAIRPLTSNFNLKLSDPASYVIDVGAREKIPRKDAIAFIEKKGLLPVQ
jgi:hypothetical protein